MEHNIETGVGFGGTVSGSGGFNIHSTVPRSLYHLECVKPDGSLRWEEKCGNVVVLDGRLHLLNQYFLGSSYTASWRVGLIKSTEVPNSTDFMASTTRDWSESTAYSNGARVLIALGAVSSSGGVASVANSSTKSSFTINQTTEIFGAFVTNSSQISTGSTYILYGAAVFASPSSTGRSVVSGDTLSVTVTLTASTS